MVEIDFEARNTRLAALRERAQAAFEHSRRIVEQSRRIRAEAEARHSTKSVPNMTVPMETARDEP
jgi:hypothetical protein